MRKAVLTIAALVLTGTAAAQGVLDLLAGPYSVVARATNERGSVFVELDGVPANVLEALRAGVRQEPGQAMAIVTPDDTVCYAIVINGTPFVYTTNWIRFVQLNHPAFRTHNLEIEGEEGQYLNDVALLLARQGTPPGSTPEAAAPSDPPPAQEGGVLERLQGEFEVIARATNDAGTVFVELDQIVGDVESALRGGLREEGFQRMAILTPDGIAYYGERYANRTFSYSRPWVDFVKYPVQFFDMDSLAFDSESSGTFLSSDGIAMAMASPYARPARPHAVRGGGGAPGGDPAAGGFEVECEFSSTTWRSTTTCYSGGRVTYRTTCTTSPVTFDVTCRSTYY